MKSGHPYAPGKVALVPIAASGDTGRGGVLLVGLNPFRKLDDNYRSFIELTARQIAASIANAGAYEVERQRAEANAELDRAKPRIAPRRCARASPCTSPSRSSPASCSR